MNSKESIFCVTMQELTFSMIFFTFTTEMGDATRDTNIGGMFIMSREVGKIMKEQC